MKFQEGDKIQCVDTRNAVHLQWNKVYKVLWCNEHYVRISMSIMRDGGGLRPVVYSVDRFEKILDNPHNIP